jgi:hypothetical protein
MIAFSFSSIKINVCVCVCVCVCVYSHKGLLDSYFFSFFGTLFFNIVPITYRDYITNIHISQQPILFFYTNLIEGIKYKKTLMK